MRKERLSRPQRVDEAAVGLERVPGRDRPGDHVAHLGHVRRNATVSTRHDQIRAGVELRVDVPHPACDRDRLPRPPLGTGHPGQHLELREAGEGARELRRLLQALESLHRAGGLGNGVRPASGDPAGP